MMCKDGVNKKPALKEPVRCTCLSGKIEIYRGMLRPWLEKPDAMLGHAAWRGDRYPHAQNTSSALGVNDFEIPKREFPCAECMRS